MSTTLVSSNSNSGHVRYDVSKIFLFGLRTDRADFDWENNGYDLDLVPGLVLGRVSATGKLVPFDSTANDGSQLPIGILYGDLGTLEAGDTLVIECTYAIAGDVQSTKLVFANGTDTLNTVVSSRQVRDHLALLGFKLVTSTEMTAYDNA